MHLYPSGRIYFKGRGLMLDAPSANGEPVIISHAHADHAVRKGEIFASPETARLLAERYGMKKVASLGYGREVDFQGMKVSLYPSGHILGSAQVLVRTSQTSLLYSGDLKLRTGYSCAPIKIPQAENLILEATFGTHRYQWPRREQIEGQVFDFIAESQGTGCVPCFLAYSLGKTQELLGLLAGKNIPVWVSSGAFKLCRVYEEFGIDLGDYRLYENQEDLPGVLVVPSQRARFLKLKRPRFATVSGWAVTRRFNRGAYQIPLSDHADFGELLRYVDRVKPLKVYTTHGYARPLAKALRNRGYDARPLDESGSGKQLSLA